MFAELGSASPGVSFKSASGLTGDRVGESGSGDVLEPLTCTEGVDSLNDCAKDLLRYGLTPSGTGNCEWGMMV